MESREVRDALEKVYAADLVDRVLGSPSASTEFALNSEPYWAHRAQDDAPAWVNGGERRSGNLHRPMPAKRRMPDATAQRSSAPARGHFLFAWRRAVLRDAGPDRLHLLALAEHMAMDGGGAFPSQATLAAETRTSVRAVKRHLRHAERAGWIRRRPRGVAKAWRGGTLYEPLIPASSLATCPINRDSSVPNTSANGDTPGANGDSSGPELVTPVSPELPGTPKKNTARPGAAPLTRPAAAPGAEAEVQQHGKKSSRLADTLKRALAAKKAKGSSEQ
jgi:hypothetical protein